ncbi:MAG: carboxymuconolactone decarboxylase family protein [Rhodanobacter sp.]|nr:MAG: carboxymuconolactone decarboxylase family protein [Rhodanobacter sp.]TAM40949.1 MAG: carboxymuconolactone decarboxylase family protein [Rhodanobacter sp.]
MQNWKQTRKDINAGLMQLNGLSPDTMKGIMSLGGAGAKTNHLDAKTRELLSLAVAVTTRCDGCIAFHVETAKKVGVTVEEIGEALGVAINLNAGAALTYSTHVLDAFANG